MNNLSKAISEFCNAASELHYQLTASDSVLSALDPNEAAAIENTLKVVDEIRKSIPFAEIFAENSRD